MCINKIIWWLIIVYSYDKISAFDQLLYNSTPTPYIQMGQFFKLCYPDRLNPVIITTNLIDIIDEIQKEDTNFPVMTLDCNFKAEQVKIFIPAHPLYIISTDSTDQLQKLLTGIKSTPIWNIASIFYFIGIEDFCQNASQILQLFWKFDLLSAFYFCINFNNDSMLYTYNPYTSRAPDVWTEIDTDDKPDDRWTLYKQSYKPNDERICKSLSYDKTRVLNGCKIKAIGDPRAVEGIDFNKTYDVSSFDTILVKSERLFLTNLFMAMNVTPIINYNLIGFYENKTARGFIKLLINGTHDMSVMYRLIWEEANQAVDVTNLYYENGFLLLTQYNAFEVPTEEVADFADINVAFVLFVMVIIVTFIAIILNTDNDYSQATLDILRLILGGGLHTSLEKLSMRICFIVAFLMTFFVNPAIQGQISSFLSMPAQRIVGSLQDVYEQKYQLYYHPLFTRQIHAFNLWKGASMELLHPVESAYTSCAEYPLSNPTAACMSFGQFQVKDALEFKLHVSKVLELKTYLIFWERKNWPLKKKVDLIASRMTEAGLLDHWDKEALHWPLKKIKIFDAIRISTQYTQFEFENVLLAYIILFLILFLATIFFGFEKLLKKILRPRKLQLRQRVVVFNRRVHVINEWI